MTSKIIHYEDMYEIENEIKIPNSYYVITFPNKSYLLKLQMKITNDMNTVFETQLVIQHENPNQKKRKRPILEYKDIKEIKTYNGLARSLRLLAL